MKDKLYTIPVNEAFHKECECPICSMYQSLEEDALDFVMGTSYMEDHIRMETNKIGFCDQHLKRMSEHSNRLGLALMLSTHMDDTIKQIETLAKSSSPAKASLFKKKEVSPLITYLHNLQNSCYVCNKINATYDRYVVTIFYLYKTEEDFRKLFKESLGFCTKHYAKLYESAPDNLSGTQLSEFIETLNKLYLNNIKRVRADLEWFIDKFDYRYANEPWKNSKDALPRSILKTNSIIE